MRSYEKDGKTYLGATAEEVWSERKTMLQKHGLVRCEGRLSTTGIRLFYWKPVAECIEIGVDYNGTEGMPRYRWKHDDSINKVSENARPYSKKVESGAVRASKGKVGLF